MQFYFCLLVIVRSSCVLLVYAEILTNTKLVSFLHIIRVVILVLTLRLLDSDHQSPGDQLIQAYS